MAFPSLVDCGLMLVVFINDGEQDLDFAYWVMEKDTEIYGYNYLNSFGCM